MAFPERALSEPRAIDVLRAEGWYWRQNGTATMHLVPPRPGPLSRTLCGDPLVAEQLTLGGSLAGPECMRCTKKAGLA